MGGFRHWPQTHYFQLFVLQVLSATGAMPGKRLCLVNKPRVTVGAPLFPSLDQCFKITACYRVDHVKSAERRGLPCERSEAGEAGWEGGSAPSEPSGRFGGGCGRSADSLSLGHNGIKLITSRCDRV